MKQFMKIFIVWLSISFLFFYSCTNLDEELYSSLDSGTWYSSEQECMLAMGSAYAGLRYRGTSFWGLFGTEVVTTDEAVVPVHSEGSNLDNNGLWRDLHKHNFSSNQDPMAASWEFCFNTVASCNQIIYQVRNSPAQFDGKEGMIAELRTLRAFALYKAVDLFGNIPIILDFTETDLPEQLTRTEAFSIIEQELLESTPNLQESPSSEYYGRCIRPVAFTILAKMYLNSEKWTGVARYNEAIAMCDSIIDGGNYSLEGNYFDNFTIQNENSGEVIFAMPLDKLIGDFGFQMHVLLFH